MKNLPVTDCPGCGAPVVPVNSDQPSACPHCGTLIQPVSRPPAIRVGIPPAKNIQSKRPKQESTRMTDQRPDKFLIVFGLFWILFASIFLIVGSLIVRSETEQYDRFMNEGEIVQGSVTALKTETSKDSDSSTETTSYYVSYQFKAPLNGDVTLFKNNESVSAVFYNSLHVEQKLEVLYIRSDPTISRLKSQYNGPNTMVGWVFGGLGSLFMLIGLLSFLAGLRYFFIQQRAKQVK